MLTVTNPCGSNSFAQTLIVGVPPTAAFAQTATSGCAPLTVDFTSAATGNPTSYAWTFPGGNPATSTAQNQTVTYAAAGTYDVNLTVSNPLGSNTASAPQLVQVGAAPTALFSFNMDEFDVTFTNSSSGGVTYDWNFGDNTTSTQANPMHTYTANGVYEVTLRVQNECGIAVSTQTVNVSVSGTEFQTGTSCLLLASPNPFSQGLVVSYVLPTGANTANLLIVNALGEQVGQVALPGNAGIVPLDGQFGGSGVYFLHLQVSLEFYRFR